MEHSGISIIGRKLLGTIPYSQREGKYQNPESNTKLASLVYLKLHKTFLLTLINLSLSFLLLVQYIFT